MRDGYNFGQDSQWEPNTETDRQLLLPRKVVWLCCVRLRDALLEVLLWLNVSVGHASMRLSCSGKKCADFEIVTQNIARWRGLSCFGIFGLPIRTSLGEPFNLKKAQARLLDVMDFSKIPVSV